MEWQIRTISRASDASGEAFAPGDEVASILCKIDGEEEIRRVDLLVSELPDFALPGSALGRWTRVIKEPEEEGDAAPGPDLESAEAFFLSLFAEMPEGGSAQAERAALKHLMALALERRRVLKREGGVTSAGAQIYRFPKREDRFEVPVVDVEPVLLVKLRETLGDILL